MSVDASAATQDQMEPFFTPLKSYEMVICRNSDDIETAQASGYERPHGATVIECNGWRR